MSDPTVPASLPAVPQQEASARASLPLAHTNAYTNQQLIDAFFDRANQLHNGNYQALLTQAGLDIHQLAADRSAPYAGPPLADLPHLSDADRELIHHSLVRQLQRRATNGTINAPAGVNVRVAPGTAHDVLTVLPLGYALTILAATSAEGTEEWLLITAEEYTGWVRAEFVNRNGATTGNLTTSTLTTETHLSGPLAPATPLQPPADAAPHVVAAAETWNQYGRLILAECARLDLDPAVAVAILGVESSGRAFEGERMIIRFENHIFWRYWGKANRAQFEQHFTNSTDGNEHRWRPDPNGAWLPCHTSQSVEWQVFELARSLDARAALYAISMGAAQIMGFNHATIGYATPQAMFDAFQSDVRHQLAALFRFIEVNHLQEAMRRADFVTFARTYNGQGQEAIYAPRMQRYYDAYRQLVEASRSGEEVARLPQPSVPPLLNMDPELLAAWRKHVAASFASNQTLYSGVMQGFLRPYWTTVWMYRILFALGVISFVLAAALAILTGRTTAIFTFGGVSVVALLGYFFNRPLHALEQNLQFLTWLGIVYNNYWTRLTMLNEEQTIQADITDVTNDAVTHIKELVAEHAKRSQARPNFKLLERG